MVSAMAEIHVVIGVVINRQKQVLMTLRQSHQHLSGMWEFPGGKLEPGEQVFAALKREFKEELDITICQAEPMLKFPYHYPGKDVLLDVWQVTDYQGLAIGCEGQQICWQPIDQIANLSYPPASQPIVDQLLANGSKR